MIPAHHPENIGQVADIERYPSSGAPGHDASMHREPTRTSERCRRAPRWDVDRSHVTTAGPPQCGHVPQSLSSRIARKRTERAAAGRPRFGESPDWSRRRPSPAFAALAAPGRGSARGVRLPMFVGMRSTTADDQAFWGRAGSTDTDWLQGLSADDEAADPEALGPDPAGASAPADRVFDELRDLPGSAAGPAPDERPPPPPAASGDFDWGAPTDDLLPTWSLDLG